MGLQKDGNKVGIRNLRGGKPFRSPGFRGHRDLKVYQLAYSLAMEIFRETRTFPLDERFSLTSQIRRSSRSVATNIAEGFRKRQYPNMLVSKLADSDAEATETQVWLDFARDCGHLSSECHKELVARYEDVGKMLHSMMEHPDRFAPSSSGGAGA
jgi:four helix bundle protein